MAAMAAQSTASSARSSRSFRAHLCRRPTARHRTDESVWVAPLRGQTWLYTNFKFQLSKTLEVALITAVRQLIHSPQLQALTAKFRTWSSIYQLPSVGHRQIFTEGLLPALCHTRTGNKTSHTFQTKRFTAL